MKRVVAAGALTHVPPPSRPVPFRLRLLATLTLAVTVTATVVMCQPQSWQSVLWTGPPSYEHAQLSFNTSACAGAFTCDSCVQLPACGWCIASARCLPVTQSVSGCPVPVVAASVGAMGDDIIPAVAFLWPRSAVNANVTSCLTIASLLSSSMYTCAQPTVSPFEPLAGRSVPSPCYETALSVQFNYPEAYWSTPDLCARSGNYAVLLRATDPLSGWQCRANIVSEFSLDWMYTPLLLPAPLSLSTLESCVAAGALWNFTAGACFWQQNPQRALPSDLAAPIVSVEAMLRCVRAGGTQLGDQCGPQWALPSLSAYAGPPLSLAAAHACLAAGYTVALRVLCVPPEPGLAPVDLCTLAGSNETTCTVTLSQLYQHACFWCAGNLFSLLPQCLPDSDINRAACALSINCSSLTYNQCQMQSPPCAWCAGSSSCVPLNRSLPLCADPTLVNFTGSDATCLGPGVTGSTPARCQSVGCAVLGTGTTPVCASFATAQSGNVTACTNQVGTYECANSAPGCVWCEAAAVCLPRTGPWTATAPCAASLWNGIPVLSAAACLTQVWQPWYRLPSGAVVCAQNISATLPLPQVIGTDLCALVFSLSGNTTCPAFCWYCAARNTCVDPFDTAACPPQSLAQFAPAQAQPQCPLCVADTVLRPGYPLASGGGQAVRSAWCPSQQRCVRAGLEPCEAPIALSCVLAVDCAAVFPSCAALHSVFQVLVGTLRAPLPASPLTAQTLLPCGWCASGVGQAMLGAPGNATVPGSCPADRWLFPPEPCDKYVSLQEVVLWSAVGTGVEAALLLAVLLVLYAADRDAPLRIWVDRLITAPTPICAARPIQWLWHRVGAHGVLLSFVLKKGLNLGSFILLVRRLTALSSHTALHVLGVLAIASNVLSATGPLLCVAVLYGRFSPRFLSRALPPVLLLTLLAEAATFVAFMREAVPLLQISLVYTPAQLRFSYDYAALVSTCLAAVTSLAGHLFALSLYRLVRWLARLGPRLSTVLAAGASPADDLLALHDPTSRLEAVLGADSVVLLKRLVNAVLFALSLASTVAQIRAGFGVGPLSAPLAYLPQLVLGLLPALFALPLLLHAAIAVLRRQQRQRRDRGCVDPVPHVRRLLMAYVVCSVLELGAMLALVLVPLSLAGSVALTSDLLLCVTTMLTDMSSVFALRSEFVALVRERRPHLHGADSDSALHTKLLLDSVAS